MSPKVVKELPPIHRNFRGRINRATNAHKVALFLVNHPGRWVEVDERPLEKRSTISAKKSALEEVEVPEGVIIATTRTVGDTVKLFARLDKP